VEEHHDAISHADSTWLSQSLYTHIMQVKQLNSQSVADACHSHVVLLRPHSLDLTRIHGKSSSNVGDQKCVFFLMVKVTVFKHYSEVSR